ncbi:MAG: MMPL family transporter [Thiotrichaceae bacterium]|nr:MMPL family transporter [Thiotrichaceae bacterium]
MSNLKVDSSNDAMFNEGDPTLMDYREFQHQFGRDDIVIAAVTSDQLFSGEMMQKLRAFHRELEDVIPWLDDVTSIVNVDWIVEENGGLKVGELGDEWPITGVVSDKLKADVLSSSLYKNSLLSADGSMTLVIMRAVAFSSQEAREAAGGKPVARVDESQNTGFFSGIGQKIIRWHDEFDAYLAGKNLNDEAIDRDSDRFFGEQELLFEPEPTTTSSQRVADQTQTSGLSGLSGMELNAFLDAIDQVVERHRTEGLDIRLAGGPIIDRMHNESIHSDILVLIAMALLVIVIGLALLLRTVTAVLLPLSVVVLAMLSTLGTMGYLGMPVSVISQALPAILLTAGVLDSVHLLSIYYQNRQRGESLDSAIINAFESSGSAVFYTSITTAAGFISFTVARLKPVADFGWMAALGIMLALLYTFLLLPALLKILGERSVSTSPNVSWDRYAKILVPLANFGVRRSCLVLVVTAVIIAVGAPGIARLDYSHDVLTWFSADEPVRVNTYAIDKKMRATVPLEIVLDTQRTNGILTPDFMKRMQQFQAYAKSYQAAGIEIGSANSLVDSLQRIHSQLAPYSGNSIPDSEGLIHQEILLYEGGGAKEIERLTNRAYSLARITLRLSWADARDYVGVREALESKANAIFGDVATVKVTGTVDLLATGAMDVIKSMLSSYLLAIFLIGTMLIALLQRFSLGLVCLIPNLLPIYTGLAIMGYWGMPIDMFTVLLGGIALGLAVDDTVHLTHGVHRELIKGGRSVADVVQSTVMRIGPAMVVTTAVMASGFLIFGFSAMDALSRFGMLLGLVMVFALISDMLITPALINLLERVPRAAAVHRNVEKV